MARQTQGAFDPATGDSRVTSLNARLRVDPQDVEARLELGRLYEVYGMNEPAREQYARVLNLDPDSLAAVEALARLLAADSLPAVRAFAEKHPEQTRAWNALGTMLEASGDLAAAEAAYRRALEQQPLAAYLHNNLGFDLLLQNRAPAAAAEFRRALELDPRSAIARNNLGLALARMGDQRGALRAFGEAGTDPATAHNNLAAALLEQGLLEESRAELMEALSARSFFPPALENFKLLLEKDRQRHDLPVAVTRRIAIPLDWLQGQAGTYHVPAPHYEEKER